MKIFEYKGETFIVSDIANYCAWDENGGFYCYDKVPHQYHDYIGIDDSNVIFEWLPYAPSYALDEYGQFKMVDEDDYIVISEFDYGDYDKNANDKGDDHIIISEFDYDDYDKNVDDKEEYYYDDWWKHCIDVNAICDTIEGLDEL